MNLLIRTSKNTANEYPARVEFQIYFEYYQGGVWKNTQVPVYGVTDEINLTFTDPDTYNYDLGDILVVKIEVTSSLSAQVIVIVEVPITMIDCEK